MKRESDYWDRFFTGMAGYIASASKDPGTKVGAVIVRPDRTIASLGYNGFPRGVDDTYQDRDHKLLRTVHAEMNAILSAREPLAGCTLYVSPLCPCATCAGAIIQSGIKRVIAQMDPDMARKPQWKDSFEAGVEMFKQAGVNIFFYLEK